MKLKQIKKGEPVKKTGTRSVPRNLPRVQSRGGKLPLASVNTTRNKITLLKAAFTLLKEGSGESNIRAVQIFAGDPGELFIKPCTPETNGSFLIGRPPIVISTEVIAAMGWATHKKIILIGTWEAGQSALKLVEVWEIDN